MFLLSPVSFVFLCFSFSFPFFYPFPFLFLSYVFYPVSFLFLCFSVPFPSLPLHFLSFPPRAQVYHRCEHFTESTLKEYHSWHSKWGIAIWEGPIANLSFLHFLKTNVQPIHILVFASFDDCSHGNVVLYYKKSQRTHVDVVDGPYPCRYDSRRWPTHWESHSDQTIEKNGINDSL